MIHNTNNPQPGKSLDDTVRQARERMTTEPMYIATTKRGYAISAEPPQLRQNYYRVNLDGSTTLIVRDHETQELMELPGHPASYPSLTTTDLALEEDTPPA